MGNWYVMLEDNIIVGTKKTVARNSGPHNSNWGGGGGGGGGGEGKRSRPERDNDDERQ